MTNDIASELAKLKLLRGSDFVGQLKLIAARREFHPLNAILVFTAWAVKEMRIFRIS